MDDIEREFALERKYMLTQCTLATSMSVVFMLVITFSVGISFWKEQWSIGLAIIGILGSLMGTIIGE